MCTFFSPETGNCPSWISRREKMTIENISWSIFTKECCQPSMGQTCNLLITSRTGIQLSHRGRHVFTIINIGIPNTSSAKYTCNYLVCNNIFFRDYNNVDLIQNKKLCNILTHFQWCTKTFIHNKTKYDTTWV